MLGLLACRIGSTGLEFDQLISAVPGVRPLMLSHHRWSSAGTVVIFDPCTSFEAVGVADVAACWFVGSFAPSWLSGLDQLYGACSSLALPDWLWK